MVNANENNAVAMADCRTGLNLSFFPYGFAPAIWFFPDGKSKLKDCLEVMMNRRIPLDGRATVLMVLLCIIWGLQQIALKAAAPDMAPVLQIGLRSGVAAILVGFFLRFKGLSFLPERSALPAGLLAGLLFSLEYLLAGEGLRHTSAAHMSVMLYTAPVFAALGLHFRIPEERLNLIQWGGIAIAFFGVVVMFYHPSAAGTATGKVVWGDFLGMLAAMSWGATTVVIRTSRLADVPSAQTVMIQLLCAFVILLTVTATTGGMTFNPSGILWVSLGYQTVIVCFFSFLIWFWLLRVYLASRLGVLSFLTPVFGVIFGVVLLNETIDARFIAGALCILSGIILVSAWDMVKRFFNKSPARTIQSDGGIKKIKP